MAKRGADAAVTTNVFVRIRELYDEVLAEMAKVTWPSMDELKTSTSVVLFLLTVIAAIIYGYDLVFQFVVLGLLKLA